MIVGLYVLIKKKSLVLNIDSETITLKINYFVRHSSGKNPPPCHSVFSWAIDLVLDD